MPDPRVAFVVTCYNLGEFLDEALASIRHQTISSGELVVVDDGSDDPFTVRTLDRLRAEGLRVVRTENRGLPAARNTGIRSTSAEFICCLDADDRLRPHFLERSLAVLDGSPEFAFASHWLRTFGDEEAEWTPARCDFPSLLDMNSVNGAALVRRRAVEAVGGFDESFVDGCEDWDFWISLVEAGYPGTIIPEVLFDYRRRPGSMSRRMIEQIGHPEMYERLVRKHTATYRMHLVPLLLRREATLVELASQVFDMELEGERLLGPELQGLRDDARLIQARRDTSQQELQSAGRLAALEQTLAIEDPDGKDALLHALESSFDDTLRRFVREHEALAGLQQELAAARAELARREAQRMELQARVETGNEQLRRSALQLESAENRLASSESRLLEAKDALDRTQHQVAWFTQDLADIRRLVAEHELRAHRAEEDAAGLRSSLSWRLTGPLRRIYALVLGLESRR